MTATVLPQLTSQQVLIAKSHSSAKCLDDGPSFRASVKLHEDILEKTISSINDSTVLIIKNSKEKTKTNFGIVDALFKLTRVNDPCLFKILSFELYSNRLSVFIHCKNKMMQ